jgi:hypothetical protein
MDVPATLGKPVEFFRQQWLAWPAHVHVRSAPRHTLDETFFLDELLRGGVFGWCATCGSSENLNIAMLGGVHGDQSNVFLDDLYVPVTQGNATLVISHFNEAGIPR